jgi:hypothetical protein
MNENFSYHLLFIGVNNGIQADKHLEQAERDAEALHHFFFNEIGYRGGTASQQNRLLTGKSAGADAIKAALNDLRRLDDCDLLLVYWAGHLSDKGDEYFFITGDVRDDMAVSKMVSLTDLLRDFYAPPGVRNRMLVLDTCFGGRAATIQSRAEQLWADGTPGFSCVFCASGANQRAREGRRNGIFTGQLLERLERAADRDTALDLVEVFTETQAGFEGPVDQRPVLKKISTGPGPVKVPMMRRERFTAPSRSTDPLEQALGYATRAFRDYLEQEIVKEVEQIFFLGYDIWDGCLVYDGRVSGSVEQLLLEYIRNRFLDDDCLRSRFEELYLTPEKLGVAGACFHRAINDLQKPEQNRNPVMQLQYCGDLRLYSSEYSEYDAFLGLRCCLYIPVTEPFVPPVRIPVATMPGEPRWGEPLGGVLVAASHKPYGLEPSLLGLHEVWAKARASYEEAERKYGATWPHGKGVPREAVEELLRLDNDLTLALRGLINTAGESHTYGAPVTSSLIDSYLSCIGGVYVQRSRQRCELRHLAHPKFVKAVTRRVKEAKTTPLTEARRKQIVALVADEVQSQPHLRGLSGLEKARRIRDDGIGAYRTRLRRDNIQDSPKVDELIWDCLVLEVWRDLRVQRRLLYRPPRQDPELLKEVETELKARGAWRDPGLENTWGNYVEARAAPPRLQTRLQQDQGPVPGEVAAVQAQLVNALMDDFRERQDGLFKIFAAPLQQLAPIDAYLTSIANIEVLLPSDEKNRCLRQLAHAVQVWLLGMWILETTLSDGPQAPEPGGLKKDILCLMCNYLRERSSLPQDVRDQVLEFWQANNAPDLLALYWGLLAATHDLAIPVQRFGDWCRGFFESFFGEKTTSFADNKPPTLLDFFHHPKFPFYKNSITSLYTADKRDWIESVFYMELSKHINHALVGSLIVVQQLETDEEFPGDPGVWRMLIDHLTQLGRSDRLHPEQGLFVPAYLAHAIAFSHLPELRRRWEAETSRWSYQTGSAPRGGHQKRLRYSQKAMQETLVSFEDFPLTYLLGLCEVLIDSPPEASPDEPWVQISRKENWRGTGLSPFYVHSVDAFWRDQPVLRITLHFWEERRIYPPSLGKRRPSRKDIDDLKKRWSENTKRRGKESHECWFVYDQDAFEALEPTWRTTADYYEENVWVEFGRAPDRTVHVTRLAYEVLRMVLRLEEFCSCYTNSKWTFQVCFNDVREGNEEYTLILRAEQGQRNAQPPPATLGAAAGVNPR